MIISQCKGTAGLEDRFTMPFVTFYDNLMDRVIRVRVKYVSLILYNGRRQARTKFKLVRGNDIGGSPVPISVNNLLNLTRWVLEIDVACVVPVSGRNSRFRMDGQVEFIKISGYPFSFIGVVFVVLDLVLSIKANHVALFLRQPSYYISNREDFRGIIVPCRQYQGK